MGYLIISLLTIHRKSISKRFRKSLKIWQSYRQKYSGGQIYKNISTLFLFPATIDLLFSSCLVYMAIYTAMYTARTRPCARPAHGRVQGCVHSRTARVHATARVRDRVHGPYTVVYTCTWPVFSHKLL